MQIQKLPWVNPVTTFGVFIINQRDGSLIEKPPSENFA